MRSLTFAKAVVLNAEGQVLLLRRSKTDMRRAGEYDFPGGGMEKGEEFATGVVREIQEETGIVVRAADVGLIYAATQPYDDASITRLLFACRVDAPEVQLSWEHSDYMWVSIEEALKAFPHYFYGTGLSYAVKHDLLPLAKK